MAYRNSLQADALKLVAKKLQSSLAVEGDLPEDGLAAYGDDGDDLMLALAGKIVNGDEDEAETVEAVFAAARDAEKPTPRSTWSMTAGDAGDRTGDASACPRPASAIQRRRVRSEFVGPSKSSAYSDPAPVTMRR